MISNLYTNIYNFLFPNCDELIAENEKLIAENEELTSKNEELTSKNEELIAENEQLKNKTFVLKNGTIKLSNNCEKKYNLQYNGFDNIYNIIVDDNVSIICSQSLDIILGYVKSQNKRWR